MTENPDSVDVAGRIRTYLRGWDDSRRCLLDTLSWIPDDQLVAVVRSIAREQQ